MNNFFRRIGLVKKRSIPNPEDILKMKDNRDKTELVYKPHHYYHLTKGGLVSGIPLFSAASNSFRRIGFVKKRSMPDP